MRPWLSILVSAGMMSWLFGKGAISIAQFRELAWKPRTFALLLFANFVVTFLSAFRWCEFTRKIDPTFDHRKHLFSFLWASWGAQCVGLWLFGIIGTDAYRFQLLDERNIPATDCLRILFLDRFSSLLGLVALGITGALFAWMGMPGACIGMLLILAGMGMSLTFASSILAHSCKLLLLVALAGWKTAGGDIAFLAKATVGLLVEVIPISWEGIGSGHFAFFKLFPMIQGAELFHTYVTGKVAFKLLGFFPLVWLTLGTPRNRTAVGSVRTQRKASIYSLRFAVRNQIRKDDIVERARVVSAFLGEHRLLACLVESLEAGALKPMKAAACLLWAALASHRHLRSRLGQSIALFKYPNETHRIESLAPVLQKYDFLLLDWRLGPIRAVHSLVYFFAGFCGSRKTAWRIWRISKRLARRYPFYVSLRAMEALLTYISLREQLAKLRPGLILISTESNPHGSAAMGVGEALGVPVVFASHGAVTTYPFPLRCSLALFYGKQSREDYERISSRIGQVLLYGFADQYQPFPAVTPDGPVCICLGTNPHLAALTDQVRLLRRSYPQWTPRIRPHPNGLRSVAKLRQALEGQAIIVPEGKLETSLRECSMVIAGNSTVHLDALLLGYHCLYLPSLDTHRSETTNFLRSGLVFRHDADEQMPDSHDVASFYGASSWAQQFSRYLNLEYTWIEFLAKLDQELSALPKG